MGVKLVFDVPLYSTDGQALWLVHPTAGEQVDIIAINVTEQFEEVVHRKEVLCQAMNQIPSSRLQAFVGDELMVVGFPRNLHKHGLPLFKRATFASEPNLFADKPHARYESNHRQVLIDCATREGMSGSPVIQVKRSMIYRPRQDNDYEDLLDGYCFYGIYTGRMRDVEEDPLTDDLLAAQIGIIWPKPLIEVVVTSTTFDRFKRDTLFERTVEII